MIQHSVFHDGSFVLHKIEINGHKYSAWYNKDGIPSDAEIHIGDRYTQSVSKRNTNVWKALETIGKRYVGKLV